MNVSIPVYHHRRPPVRLRVRATVGAASNRGTCGTRGAPSQGLHQPGDSLHPTWRAEGDLGAKRNPQKSLHHESVFGRLDMIGHTLARQTRILRPCSIPGCSELTSGGPCEQHRRARQREHDERRGSSRDRGYDADHRRLRVLCFQRDGWRCVDCGWEPDIVADFRRFELGEPPTDRVLAELSDSHNRGERHLHADHQIPIAERPDLRLDLDNLRTRCDSCHRAKTQRECIGTGRPVK
jgi:5-methylcytosine-specific restriction enzyme A